MPNILLCFVHNRRHQKGGKSAIELRITSGKSVKYISTGVKVLSRCWDKWSERVWGCPDSVALNKKLAVLRGDVEEMLDDGLEVSDIRARLKNVIKRDATFLDYVERRIRERVAAKGTVKHWEVWLRKMREWGEIVYFSDLTTAKVMRMDEWCRRRGLMVSTVYTYHKALRLFCNDAVADGFLDKSPYTDRRFTLDRGERKNIPFLPEEKMKEVMYLELDGYLDKARDLFVFQMYTGLSYADMQNFKIKNYHQENGVWIYNGNRKKTGEMYVSQLLKPAVEVLRKHRWKIPKISNQKYNNYLKEIGSMIGVPDLHSHMGRSSFATLMLSKGCRIQNVAKMLGHTNIKQTQRYANVLAKDVLDDYARIDSML